MNAIAYEAKASPFGWIVAQMFAGASLDGIEIWHPRMLWWFHMVIASFMLSRAVVPFTKLWHIFHQHDQLLRT
jgi:hypothetical protein